MGTHGSFIFGGYNPYIGGVKPSFFHGLLGSKGRVSIEASDSLVSWSITYLRDLQLTYRGVVIHLLSTMDIFRT